MDGGSNCSFKRNFIMNCPKIKTSIFTFFLVALLGMQSNCYADTKLDTQKSNIENKRGQVKEKIIKLKLLEKIETNKLYKNQQKLEHTQHDL